MAKIYLKIKPGAGDCISYDGELCYFKVKMAQDRRSDCGKTYYDEKHPCIANHAYIQVPAPEEHK